MSNPNPTHVYTGIVCRGSLKLGTGCRLCERCQNERRMMDQAAAAERSDTHAPSPSVDTAAGLPVAGYKKVQPKWALDLVNENKVLEEKVLRQIDRMSNMRGLDGRSVQMARGMIEDAFMRLNRGVFQPARLEGDLE